MQIDVLVVRKETGRVIQKNIGRIFRQYNVVEYKGIKDYISINDFYKSIGYACLLQSNTERVQEILPSQVTVTFACVFGKGLWSAYGGGSPGDILH